MIEQFIYRVVSWDTRTEDWYPHSSAHGKSTYDTLGAARNSRSQQSRYYNPQPLIIQKTPVAWVDAEEDE